MVTRATKLLVIASNLVALWLIARLVSRGFPPILIPTFVAFLVSLVSAAALGNIVVSLILPLVYFVPALSVAWFNNFSFSYYAIWLAALCGAMLPRSVGSTWAYPARFTFPLVLWSLALALSWPIVMLRELDFVPALFHRGSLWNSRLMVSPPIVCVWILSVASISVTGLLLLDWLFLAYPAHRNTDRKGMPFERRVIWPLLAAAVVAAFVALYQSLVDITVLNRAYAPLGRAVGTMLDANAFGAVIGLWLPVAVALAIGGAGRRRWVTALLALLAILLALALWGTGSRTALLTALIGVAFVVGHAWRSLNLRQGLAGIATVAVAIALIAYLLPASTTGPGRRVLQQIRGLPVSIGGLEALAGQLWSRSKYGDAAMRLIAEHPYVGVGVGGYQYEYADALYRIDGSVLPPDNAQNWYRQQLAELGVLGSVGWIAWMCMFIWLILRRRGGDDRRAVVGAVKGALVGLGAASMLGMPTQDTAASITFVVLVAWCLKLTAVEKERAHRPAHDAGAPFGKAQWVVMAAVLVCFLGATAYAAWTDLRPPYRALRADYAYQYGFYPPDPKDPAFRWTNRKAVDVFPVEKRWLKLVVGAVAPDAAQSPVPVRVRFNRQEILRVNRQGNFPITRWIRMPDGHKYVMMQIDVGRTWQGRGVAVGNWVFSDEDPPKGSITVE